MPKKTRAATATEAGRDSVESLDPANFALVITFGGIKIVPEGPFKGERAIDPPKIYVQGKLMALVSRLDVSLVANEPLPQLRFTFGDLPPKLVAESHAVKEVYEKFVGRVREALPWATFTSPVGNNGPTKPMDVLDPGTIQPATPKAPKRKKRRG